MAQLPKCSINSPEMEAQHHLQLAFPQCKVPWKIKSLTTETHFFPHLYNLYSEHLTGVHFSVMMLT